MRFGFRFKSVLGVCKNDEFFLSKVSDSNTSYKYWL